MCAGCGSELDVDRPQPEIGKAAAAPMPVAAAVGETWDVYHMQGTKVGYARTTARRVDSDKSPRIHTEQVVRLKVMRSGQPFEAETQAATWQTPQGELVECEYRMPLGTSAQRGRAIVRDNRLLLDVTVAGRTESKELPWKAGMGGYFAVEQSLLDRPMQPGERRAIALLLPPPLDDVGVAELVARDYEPTPLLSGTFRLLRIEQSLDMPGGRPLESVLWTNLEGEVVKTFLAAGNLETFRTTKEIALRESASPKLDLGFDVAIPVDRPLENPHDTRRVVYEAALEGGDPSNLFPFGVSQEVEAKDKHTARITVRRVRPNDPPDPGSGQRQPTDEDRAASSLVQSEDPRVAAMAGQAAGDETDPWMLAVRLERFVHETITAKDYSQAFASAAEVARTRQGDCTEHAVLLAAVCRAQKIPARLAMGLIYQREIQGFAYHMWNEVWIGDRWIPLDATLGRGGIGAAHLKLADSNFQGASAYSSFLPVLEALGRLKIKVMEAE